MTPSRMTSVERLPEDVLDGASVRPGISVRPPQSMRSAEWGRSGLAAADNAHDSLAVDDHGRTRRRAGARAVEQRTVAKTVAPIAGSSMREGPRGAMAQHCRLQAGAVCPLR